MLCGRELWPNLKSDQCYAYNQRQRLEIRPAFGVQISGQSMRIVCRIVMNMIEIHIR